VRPFLATFFTHESLYNLITSIIQPSDWTISGGPAMQRFGDVLVVTHTQPAHRQLEQLLATIEAHCLPGTNRSDDSPWVVPITDDPSRARVEQMLAEPISVNYRDVPLPQALERLGGDHKISIVLDSLESRHFADGIWPTISLHAENVHLSCVLDRLLLPHSLMYGLRGNVIWISTSYDWTRTDDIRLYCVGDLAEDAEGQRTLIDRMFAESPINIWGGPYPPRIVPINDQWLAVATSWARTHERTADWLTEQRTGQPPKRELERRAFDDELDKLRSRQ
jgi:hypothetical protein